MTKEKNMRLSQVARKLNVGTTTVVSFLAGQGFEVENKPNTKITPHQFKVLAKEFSASAIDKEEASEVSIGPAPQKSEPKVEVEVEEVPAAVAEPPQPPEPPQEEKVEHYKTETPKLTGPTTLGTVDIDKFKKNSTTKKSSSSNNAVAPKKKTPPPEPKPEIERVIINQRPAAEPEPIEKITFDSKKISLEGPKVVGNVDLPVEREKKKFMQVASSDEKQEKKKRPRKRVDHKPRGGDKQKAKEALSEKEIQEQIKSTLAKLGKGDQSGSTNRAKYRKEKRIAIAEAREKQSQQEEAEAKILKITEFISVKDLASLMGVSSTEVLSTCMELGMMTSINQRLDAEAITIIADEYGFSVQFLEAEEEKDEEQDLPEDLEERAPIVTIMGHVDHGKTSLLDFIRDASVTETEAGGITQHIGAYDVTTKNNKRVVFLDTPGHEAFTAMRARGAKITDIAIIIVAADDDVMPQTKEAINHAQLANVPLVIAINKIDKPGANPDKIKESLAAMNILVEDWGGKYQCQAISAKKGDGIDELLEKVLLEAELLELKANPNRKARGTIIEASLDKGRGYLATVMVQNGTLKKGDIMLAGGYYGKVKAMFDHRGKMLGQVIPATPVQVLGLDGAPQAGDTFQIMDSDKEAREIATKRQQILREQTIRTKQHITLDEIGRRLAIGNFKELNVILKGDVDGSVEALSDSLLKLSTDSIQVNIIQKAVGQISESDVLLASASDAIVIGFQVRPSANARKLAEKEGIDVRLYSVIYDAINHIKDAMEGMLAPVEEEVITGNAEVREVFKISKVGTVAGCYVTDGFLKRSNEVRLIRDGIVIYTGGVKQMKRFKEDIQEVKTNFECGISIENFNDIKMGDVIEGFEKRSIKQKL